MDTEGADEADELDPEGDLFAILNAADRDRCPGARPLVSFSPADPDDFRAEVEHWLRRPIGLRRRGLDLGQVVELDDALMFAPREPLKVYAQRFAEARPIVLHDAAPPELLERFGPEPPTHRLFTELGRSRDLGPLVGERKDALRPDFRILGPGLPAGGRVGDDDRDLDARTIAWRESDPDRPSRSADDLWIKLQGLSTHDGDGSLRVRVSFGREVDDDASRDLFRHRLVGRLAERIFPELEVLHRDEELRGLLSEWMKTRPLFTQSIAYWNAPDGGALLHHDAFDEPDAGRQRGVLYVQVSGSTAWFALSTEDLIQRLVEFGELIEDGTLAEAAAQTFLDAAAQEAFLGLLRAPVALRAELAREERGTLAPVLHGSPEFLALLADAGHGFVLGPGDVVILPNNGLRAGTCHHTVFCASEAPGLAFSLAVRESRTTDPAGPGRTGSRPHRGRRRRGRRNRGRPGKKL